MPKKRKKRKKRVGPPKRRNPYALIASMRSGAGFHGKGRPDKEASRTACRGRMDVEDYLDEEEEDGEL